MTTDERALIGAAMEDWIGDEWAPDEMKFDEWVKQNRPELIPLLEKIPPAQ